MILECSFLYSLYLHLFLHLKLFLLLVFLGSSSNVGGLDSHENVRQLIMGIDSHVTPFDGKRVISTSSVPFLFKLYVALDSTFQKMSQMAAYRLFSHNVVTIETSAIGWPP